MNFKCRQRLTDKLVAQKKCDEDIDGNELIANVTVCNGIWKQCRSLLYI